MGNLFLPEVFSFDKEEQNIIQAIMSQKGAMIHSLLFNLDWFSFRKKRNENIMDK